MKKYYILSLFLLLTMFGAIGCSKKNISTSIEVESEITLDNNELDITNEIKSLKVGYESLYAFGLKHGLLYSNGEQTKGIPIMEEITPLNIGDEVVLPIKETRINDVEEYKLDLKETDIDKLRLKFKNMSREDILIYLGSFDDFSPVGIVGEDSETALGAGEEIFCYMGYNDLGDGKMEFVDMDSMSDSEFFEHALKIISYGNQKYNESQINYKKSFDNYPKEVEVTKDDYMERSPEYQKWYTENIVNITRVRGMDFTKEVLPDGIIFKDDKYYLDKSIIKPDENGMVTFTVYGQTISLNVL